MGGNMTYLIIKKRNWETINKVDFEIVNHSVDKQEAKDMLKAIKLLDKTKEDVDKLSYQIVEYKEPNLSVVSDRQLELPFPEAI